MSHVREQIIAAVTTRLTGLSTTGANVQRDPVHAIAPTALPALTVILDPEDIEAITMGGDRTLQRVADVQIEAVAKAASGAFATLETIIKEVEVAMISDRTFGGLVKDSGIFRIERVAPSEAEQPIAAKVITWRVMYATLESDPETAV